ncbi:MAG: transglutaminase family protein [Methylococcales bacterium]|nr:transglutaminase family protein [Methylococcales bacterium]MDD5631813.1 transglutaminase family protein [Methylococcales bacterium]
MDRIEFEEIVKAQDDLIHALDVNVWIGMEPTFTRRFAETPEWLSEALGSEKLQFAYALLNEIYQCQPGGVVLHTLGRQYSSEDLPRWNIGYYQARNNQFTWEGPPDPSLIKKSKDATLNKSINIEAFGQALNNALNRTSWQSSAFIVNEALSFRILFRRDGTAATVDVDSKTQLARSSVHGQQIPLTGLTDDLSANGDFLLCLGTQNADSHHYEGISAVIELPELPDVSTFVQLMQCIVQAAKEAPLESLVIQGFPPPVDASIAWTTITPDPAVIEINQAPADNSANFYRNCELVYNAARTLGLFPYRLHYNGIVSDSGGGGQFTLGGPEPLNSPFFRYPHLLPRLIRYLNAHPALSYWFAPPSIGSSSQSPRTDESVVEFFLELSLALEQLEKNENPSPEFIWSSLSPFLVDPSGNPHRSELNIEKLWNPYLPGRGCLGLVEFRAFRMSRSPQCATAISVLLRSIVAMLSQQDKVPDLLNHGLTLHDKYALPFYLQMDLRHVFKDLQNAGLPLHDSIISILLEEPVRFIGNTSFHGCNVELHQALEFWPLVGDVASQEGGGSRLMDASTTRIQIVLSMDLDHSTQLGDWELGIDGYRMPLRLEQGEHGPVKITGIRYRNFQPIIGLHPGIGSRNFITLVIANPGLNEALEITYSEWQPQGLAYPGLPEDMVEAELRRAERFITKIIPFNTFNQFKAPPASAVTDFCVDLRRL